MHDRRNDPDEYTDQDAEPTSNAPPEARPNTAGPGAQRTAGEAARADSADVVDADMDQDGEPNP